MSDMEESKAKSEGHGAQLVGKVREGPTEKVTFGQNPGWKQGASHMGVGWRVGTCVQEGGNSKGQGPARKSEEACWLPWREPAGRMGGGRQSGQTGGVVEREGQ